MPRLLKKSDRLQAQAGQIKYLTDKGYQLEEYKSLKILTATVDARQGIAFSLKVYTGTAANESLFKYYRTDEQRAEVIKNIKANTDRRETYKTEQKAKGRQLTGAAQAAAAIREELKTKFKGVKFSVTSDNFSMGNSVSITWTDGPTEDEVSAITGKYQYGHFNGMEDIYEYSNSREDIPQAKFVSEHRKQSEETRKAIDAAALELWPGEEWEQKRHREQQARKLFNETPIPIGATVTGIERGDETNHYKDRLIYTAPDQPNQEEHPEPVEVPAGTIQIIDYSEKAIAVIGETKPIKDKLKELGGRFNFRLTCGPGWIFKKSDLQKITAALSKPAAVQAPEPEEIPEEPTPEEAAQIEELTEDPTSTEGKTFATYEEAEEAALIKVRARAMAKHTETNPPAPLQEETAKNYDTLEDIEEAANSGQVISLYNLHELVNKKKPAAQAMREAAEKLNTMADKHSAQMEKVRAEIAEEVQKIKEIGVVPEGYTRSEHPETPSGYLTREEVKQYNAPASIEARRIESDQRKAGKSNTALPAPQMFINF